MACFKTYAFYERKKIMIEILNTIEHEDGSATIILEMSDEENRLLIEYAVVNLLKEYIEREKKGTK